MCLYSILHIYQIKSINQLIIIQQASSPNRTYNLIHKRFKQTLHSSLSKNDDQTNLEYYPYPFYNTTPYLYIQMYIHFYSGGRVSKFCRSVIRQRPARQSVIISGRPSPSVHHSVIVILTALRKPVGYWYDAAWSRRNFCSVSSLLFGLVTVRETAENRFRRHLFHQCFKVSVSRQSVSKTGVRQ